MHDPDAAAAEAVDLENCAREPIHLLGRVQGFGCLIAVSADWIVSHASLNTGEFLGIGAAGMIGTPFIDHFPQEVVHRLRTRMQLLSFSTDGTVRVFDVDLFESGRLFDVAIHVSGRSYVFEFEPKRAAANRDEAGLVMPLIARVRRHDTAAGAAREAARAVKALTGFDRVMVYRFEPDRSGRVIAEAAETDEGGYLGLRFPASDIPAQARALYTRNLLRIIPDVDGPTHEVVPAVSPSGTPLDLSLAISRAVSPIHLEYLRNMGVAASMSVSILRKGELWGLIACHNAVPLHVDYEKRSAVELFAQLFAYELARIEHEAEIADADRARRLHDVLMNQISSGVDLTEGFDTVAERIGEVIAHDGIALWSQDRYVTSGLVPTAEEFRGLARFLNTAAASDVFATDALSTLYPAGAAFADRAAGVLALPISRAPRDYIVLFRREVAQTVSWAGNPEKAVSTTGPNGARLTPRKSFEAWQEVVRGTSIRWTPAEIGAAGALRVTLLEVILKLTDEAEAQHRRAVEQQELLIAELNHRVRNILNLIRGLVSQGRGEADDIEAYASVLDTRIHALSRAHDQLTEKGWGWTPLRALLETEARAFLATGMERLRIHGAHPDLSPQAFTTLALVFHEMVTNSAKYGALSAAGGQVDLTLEIDAAGALSVGWVESGGPPVETPTRRGFGSTIISRSVPFELGGSAEVAYPRTGLEARFTVPADHIRAGAEAAPGAEPAAPPGPVEGTLSGRVLVVEDNMIIAMDAADMLSELGAEEVLTSASVRDALATLERGDVSFAFLDVNLGKETSVAVAEACAARNVPFVLATGYGASQEIARTFPPAPVVKKPYTLPDIRAGLAAFG